MFHRLRKLSRASNVVGAVIVLASMGRLGWSATRVAVSVPDSSPAMTMSAPAETMIEGVTPEEEVAQHANLHEWLMSELPAGVMSAPIVVRLGEQERSELQRMQELEGGPSVVGRVERLARWIQFSSLATSRFTRRAARENRGILEATADGGFVWAVALRSEQAGAIRIHVSGLSLPADADMFFFNTSGQAFGPYTGAGPNGDGDFWTNTVFGSEGILLVRDYGPEGAADLKALSFLIEDVGHIGPHFAPVASTESFCSFNVPCIENASCHNGTPGDPARSAVALMQWVAGAFIYTCTGGLLNDTVSTSQIPYFLTANHCISRSADAQNLESYFQFSLPCGSTSCPAQTSPGGIQRLGATIKATGAVGDYTLLQLNQAPPSGSVFLGWNSTPIANTNSAALYRISHPAWAPQAYSAGAVSTSAPTCQGWPRGERIYSRTTTGGTEGGSSGSPVLNASSQVVGQLSGACGTNTGNSCDNVNNATVDGAFAAYWTSVQPYLSPGGGCVPVAEVCNDGIDNDCDNLIDCADPNCAGSPSCGSGCSPVGASCTTDSTCCSLKCKGSAGRKTCR